VLLAHNRYQQRGGEDAVVEAESALLRQAGHIVEHYERHNDDIAPEASRLALARDAIWSRRTVNEVGTLMQRFRPDVLHVHNTTPLISPSVYQPARGYGVAVVQTLHNFRLICPQALLLRQGRVCKDCVGHVPWRAVLHRCYRGSATQSAVVAATVQWHRWRGTWRDDVDLYIALNESARQLFVEGGLPAHRLRVKPNAVAVPDPGDGAVRRGLLFVGRLAPEKGVALLMDPGVLPPDWTLTVVGEGPLSARLSELSGVVARGWQPRAAVLDEMRRAQVLVVPSIWPEMFGLVVIEAFASGLPVVASRIGALASLVEHGQTGLLFEPGDSAGLARQLRWAQQHPDEMRRMGRAARQAYEARYTPEANLRMLETVYEEARKLASAPAAP